VIKTKWLVVVAILLSLAIWNLDRQTQGIDEEIAWQQRNAEWQRITDRADEACLRTYGRECPQPSFDSEQEQWEEIGQGITGQLRGQW